MGQTSPSTAVVSVGHYFCGFEHMLKFLLQKSLVLLIKGNRALVVSIEIYNSRCNLLGSLPLRVDLVDGILVELLH